MTGNPVAMITENFPTLWKGRSPRTATVVRELMSRRDGRAAFFEVLTPVLAA